MEHEGGDARAFRCQLQTPAREERQGFRLADHGGKRRAAQPFLHGPENVPPITRMGEDQPVGREAMKRKPWRVKIGFVEAPENRAPRRHPGQNAGKERGCSRPILARRPCPTELMQRRHRQAAAG